MGHHRDIMLRRGDINSLKFLSNFPAGFPRCDTESGHLKPSRRITLKCILMRKMAQIIRWHSHFFFKNLILTPVVWQSIKLDLMDRFENIKTYSLTWLLVREWAYALCIWFINSLHLFIFPLIHICYNFCKNKVHVIISSCLHKTFIAH